MQVRFRLEAASDIASARDWYDQQRSGLGSDFVEALEEVVQLVSEFPDAFPEIATGLRRAILRRFPYCVYYRTAPDTVDVIACLHGSRSPHVWRSRG